MVWAGCYGFSVYRRISEGKRGVTMNLVTRLVVFGVLIAHTFSIAFLVTEAGLPLSSIALGTIGCLVLTAGVDQIVTIYSARSAHKVVENLDWFECCVNGVNDDGSAKLLVKTQAKGVFEFTCTPEDLALIGLDRGNLVRGRVKYDVL